MLNKLGLANRGVPDMLDVVKALVVRRDTRRISAMYLPYSDLREFRRKAFLSDLRREYPGIKSLVADQFDRSSLHIVYIKSGEIHGSARIVRVSGEELPFLKLFPDIEIHPTDFELSRFVSSADLAGGKAFVFLLSGIANALVRIPLNFNHRIFADVISGYPRTINRNTYLDFGFSSLNRHAYDEDYGLQSEIFVLHPHNVAIFLKKSFHFQNFISGIKCDETVTPVFIAKALLHWR